MTSNSQSLMARLRDATREQHARLDNSTYFQALNSKQLAVESYVGLLRSMATVHATMETAITTIDHTHVAGVWNEGMRKTPLIEKDLSFFFLRDVKDIPEAVFATLRLADRMKLRASEQPSSLLGFLYVLEGSALGGIILRRRIAEAFQLTGSDGTNYLSSYGQNVREHWRTFSEKMDNLHIESDQQTYAIDAAVELFEGLSEIFDKLHPFDKKLLRPLATALNPEAGYHAIPNDSREIEAALRAGERTWKKYPYYHWRYGERGKKFTASDSAWIASLSHCHQSAVNQQIGWLSQVLSTRGMPSLLLHEHLHTLFEELCAAIPEKQQTYKKLFDAANTISTTNQIQSQKFLVLISEFEATASPDWLQRLPEAGSLLIASVVDEQRGIKGAVESIAGWMTDPDRFPPDWIVAVKTLLDGALKS